jgi:hypothetical protein
VTFASSPRLVDEVASAVGIPVPVSVEVITSGAPVVV